MPVRRAHRDLTNSDGHSLRRAKRGATTNSSGHTLRRASRGSGESDEDGGGILGTLGRIPGAFLHGGKIAFVDAPAGAVDIVAAPIRDVAAGLGASVASGTALAGGGGLRGAVQETQARQPLFGRAGHSEQLIRDIGRSYKETTLHPLRDPFATLMNYAALGTLGTSGAFRAAAAGRALGETGELGAAAKAFGKRPTVATRTLEMPGQPETKVELPTSQSLLRGNIQRARDKSLQKKAEKGGRQYGVIPRTAEHYQPKLAGKIATQLQKEASVTHKVETTPHREVKALGERYATFRPWRKHVSAAARMGLTIVSEGKPVEDALRFTRQRIDELEGDLKNPAKEESPISIRREIKRHQRNLKLIHQAGERYVKTEDGKPVFRDSATTKVGHLRDIYGAMERSGRLTEKKLVEYTDFTEEGLASRKAMPGRVIGGARWVEPTPGRLGRETPALGRARARVASLERHYERAVGKREQRLASQAPEEAGPDPMLREGPTYKNQIGDEFRTDLYAHMPEPKRWRYDVPTKLNLYDEAGNIRGSITYDARPDRKKIYVESIYVDPAERGSLEVLHRLTKPIVDDGREIDATFDNERLGKVFAKVVERGRLERARQAEKPVAQRRTPPPSQFGPTEERLGAALSVARDELQRLEKAAQTRVRETGLVGDEGVTNPEGLYLPGMQRSGPVGRAAVAAQGVISGRPRAPAAVRQSYTGSSKIHALEPGNIVQALGEHGLEVARWTGKLDMLKALGRLGRPDLPKAAKADDWRFVRTDTGELGRETKDILAKIERGEELTASEGMSFAERMKALGREAIGEGSPRNQELIDALVAEGKGFWVPKSAVEPFSRAFRQARTDRASIAGGYLVDEVNNAMKFATLYLKPAYGVVNVLGNLALAAVHQGFAAPGNLKEAVILNAKAGPAVTRGIDELIGEGISGALRGQGRGPGSAAATKGARFWSKYVDRVPRRAAFLHEARKAGVGTAQQLEDLLFDPANRTKLTHVTEKANEAMISFDELSMAEQSILRRLIYFYPWVKGSTRYTAQLPLEHPVTTAALSGLGQQGEALAERTLGQVPYYLEGSFGIGNNRLVNPASASITQTPIQLAEAAGALVTNRRNLPSLESLGSPAVTMALNAIRGENELGIPLRGKGGPLGQSIWDQAQSLPLPLLYQRIQMARRGEGQQRVFPPNIMDALGLWAAGGAFPRKVNPAALRAAYYREMNRR